MIVVAPRMGRVDKILADACPEYSRAALAKLFDLGFVTIDGRTVAAGHKVREGVTIDADLSPLNNAPRAIDLPIIYEDEHVLVVNKPSGVISHARGRYWQEPSVASFAKSHIQHSSDQTKSSALTTTRCYSFVMGGDEALKNKLELCCDLVEPFESSYRVVFNILHKDEFATVIKEHLRPGFWNEYITPNSVDFIFKDLDETIKTYTATTQNAPYILSLCRRFAKQQFTSLEIMLSENSWYKENNLTSDHIHYLLMLPVAHRSSIVHRLDRATSGIMICAKNEEALRLLQAQFSDRKVKKSYFAVVSNPLPSPEGIIDIPIMRNPSKPATFMANRAGKSAKTKFVVVAQTTKGTLVELFPVTGRTHQIRVHLAYLGCPIVGDTLYSGKLYSRLLLHAHTLTITLPGKHNETTFEAPLPKDFESYINSERRLL